MTSDFSGHDPEVVASLANERNELAWQRTALSWLASGGAVARYFAPGGILSSRALVGWLMLVVGGVIWLDGAQRYRRHAAALAANRPTAVPVNTIRLVWLVTVAVIATVIAVELQHL